MEDFTQFCESHGLEAAPATERAVALYLWSILTTAQPTEGEADYDTFADFGRKEAAAPVEKARRFVVAVEEQVLPNQ